MPTASPGSQEKMCRAGFLQLLIANVLDRTPVCKVRAMVFPLKSRENLQRRICASLQRKRLFCMTRVQPRTNNLGWRGKCDAGLAGHEGFYSRPVSIGILGDFTKTGRKLAREPARLRGNRPTDDSLAPPFGQKNAPAR